MVNSDMIVDRPRPVLARVPYLPRIQRSEAALHDASTFSRFVFMSLRTLSTLLHPEIPSKPIRIKSLRTLRKTTEGCHSRTSQRFNIQARQQRLSPSESVLTKIPLASPLESALTQNAPATPLESALTIYMGGGVGASSLFRERRVPFRCVSAQGQSTTAAVSRSCRRRCK